MNSLSLKYAYLLILMSCFKIYLAYSEMTEKIEGMEDLFAVYGLIITMLQNCQCHSVETCVSNMKWLDFLPHPDVLKNNIKKVAFNTLYVINLLCIY